ncbi:purine-cytosine permease family protein [Gleimia hominis]|uniref:purine-cytosine permease family protein n=1 Tax=Gleimia hominis TaxID=595468 RepID=UPI000C7F963F|nr:cytosine permease [Gleimia hominis]WIK63762.1 cytosine permease [Gleimia hominis]
MSIKSFFSSVEERGIEPVPLADRNGNPKDLFWVWFAANISILGIPLGASLVALGLNLWQAVFATVVGAVGSFALVGAVSVAGRIGGAPSLTLSRSIFGTSGNRVPTLVAMLSRLGWETVNTVTGALALMSLVAIVSEKTIVHHRTPVVVISILIFVLLTVLVSGFGHHLILKVQKYSTWVFGLLTLIVVFYLASTVDWQMVLNKPGGSLSAVLIGVGIIAGGTGLGWVNSGADMARYQHPKVSSSSLIASAAFGAGIPLIIVIGIGSVLGASNATLTQAADPISVVREALPTWVAVAYLIAAFAGLVMSNNLSVYSAGLTLITLGVRIPRYYAVIVDVIVITIGAAWFLLGSDTFYGPFITFISLLAVPLSAWTGIFLWDLSKRKTYREDSLLDTSRSGLFYFLGGFAPGASCAWLAGTVFGYLFYRAQVSADVTWFAGPFADTWLGRNGLAWLACLLVATVLYALLRPMDERILVSRLGQTTTKGEGE